MNMGGGHHNHHMKKKPYSQFKSLEKSSLPKGELREVELRLTGDMESYNWSFNNTPLSAADKIKISRGEVVRFNFVNETMMHHPIHLHGHFFRVLAGNGEYDPVKHTVDIAPLESLTIEFYANEKKDWFFHCHNLYHAKTGMARVISYGDELNSELQIAKKRSNDIMDTDYYFSGTIKLLNDYAQFDGEYFNWKHGIDFEAQSYDYEYETFELNYFVKTSRWSHIFVGGEFDENEEHGKFGLRYVWPMLIESEIYITDEGELEMMLETEFQLTKRFQSHLEFGTEEFYHLGIEYRLDEMFSVEAAYTDLVEYSMGAKLRF